MNGEQRHRYLSLVSVKDFQQNFYVKRVMNESVCDT